MALFSPLDAENMILVTISRLAYGWPWKKNTRIMFQHLEEKTKPFQHQKKISYQKYFSSHSISTVSVENNYFLPDICCCNWFSVKTRTNISLWACPCGLFTKQIYRPACMNWAGGPIFSVVLWIPPESFISVVGSNIYWMIKQLGIFCYLIRTTL